MNGLAQILRDLESIKNGAASDLNTPTLVMLEDYLWSAHFRVQEQLINRNALAKPATSNLQPSTIPEAA